MFFPHTPAETEAMLRTIGVKNLETEALASPKVVVEGRETYHENVVLDLDYTVLMPRR